MRLKKHCKIISTSSYFPPNIVTNQKIIEEIKPDLCILDLMMETDDSGFILSYKIKRRYPDVPIIIATAVTAETGMSFDVMAEENQRWINADLFLDKGIRIDQLQREIKKLLKM